MRAFVIFCAVVFVTQVWAESAEQVKEKSKAAAQSAVEFSKEKKEEFVNEMQEKIAALKAEVVELKKKADAKSDEKIKKIEKKQAALEDDLSHLKKSTGKAWSKMKTGVSKAWDQLKESFDEAKTEIRK